MKTDDLIAMLATAPAASMSAKTARSKFFVSLALGVIAALIWLVLRVGVNPNIVDSDAALPMFWVKFAGYALMAVFAGIALFRGARPGQESNAWAWAALALAAGIIGLGVKSFVGAPPETRTDDVMKPWWRDCLQSIPLLSVPMLVATFWALRQFAPTQLTIAGTIAGFVSGATGAAVYALHCTEYDPGYVALWYSIGVLIPTLIGAVLGRWLLRW